MTDGPIIDLPRSEYRWIGEKVRHIKERFPPMWERVWFFVLGLILGIAALQALWLGVTGQVAFGRALLIFAPLALGGVVFIYTTVRPRPLPVKHSEASNAD